MVTREPLGYNKKSKKLLLCSKDNELGKILNLSSSMIYIENSTGKIDQAKSKLILNNPQSEEVKQFMS